VVYYAPLPLEDPDTRRESFTDRFDSCNDWASVTGAHAVDDVGADSALNVEGTITVRGNYRQRQSNSIRSENRSCTEN
jgi:hypothetical protein